MKLTPVLFSRLKPILENRGINVTFDEAQQKIKRAFELMAKVDLKTQRPEMVLSLEELKEAKWWIYYVNITDESMYKGLNSSELIDFEDLEEE